MTAIRTYAAIGFNLGVAADAVTEPVRAALMKDILQLVAVCPANKSFMVHLPRAHSVKLRGIIEAMDASTVVQVKTYTDIESVEADCWCRYIVEEEVLLKHESIYDRDFRVEKGGTTINTRIVFPVQPAYNVERMAPPLANPLNKPMPNPYSRPWFQFAKLVKAALGFGK